MKRLLRTLSLAPSWLGLYLEDVLVLAAFAAVVTGLGMIYRPLAFLVPGTAFLVWSAWRRRDVKR